MKKQRLYLVLVVVMFLLLVGQTIFAIREVGIAESNRINAEKEITRLQQKLKQLRENCP